MKNAKSIAFLMVAAVTATCVIASMAFAAGHADKEGSPIFGVTISAGYRQWELVAASHKAGSFDELRSVLGNAVAMKAYREGTLPFPDGSILVKLTWKQLPLAGMDGAFVPGQATTVQS
jgi:Cytochrome P460